MRARRRAILGCLGALSLPLLAGVPGPAGAAPGDRGLLVDAGGHTVGTTPYSLVTADLDLDGNLDLATANINGNSVSVLLGDGAGGFTPAPGSPYPASHASELRVGFVNGDALPDLVTIRKDADFPGQTDYLLTLLAAGGGAFAPAVQGPVVGPRAGNGLVLDDLTGDGTVDAAYTNSIPNEGNLEHRFVILRGNGDGSWTQIGEYTDRVVLGGSSNGQTAIVATDLDGDGDPDVALGDQANQDVSTWFNDGLGGYTPGSRIPLGRFTGDMVADDVDGDGDADLLVGNQNYNSVSVLLNDGAGALAPAAWSPIAVPGGALDLALGDVDDDGFTDVVVGYPGSLEVLLGDGTGHYVRGWSSPYAADDLSDLQVGDLDGDGFADVARTDNSFNRVYVLLSRADNDAPVVTFGLEPAAPPSGWFTSVPQVTVSAADVGAAGVGSLRCVTNPTAVPASFEDLPGTCVPQPEMNRLNHLYAAARDRAGNTGPVEHFAVRVDAVEPVTTIYATTSVTPSGWHIERPTAVVLSLDPLSGVAATRCVLDPATPPTSYADLPDECPMVFEDLDEGVHRVYGASVDAAGNVGQVGSRELRVDVTPPTVQASAVVPDPVVQGEPAEASLLISDSLSGPRTFICDRVWTADLGPGSVACRAFDVAGNVTVHNVGYTVIPPPDAGVTLTVDRAPGASLAVDAVVTNDSAIDVGDLVLTVPTSLRVDSAPGCTIAAPTVTCPMVDGEVLSERSLLVTPRTPGPHSISAAISPEASDSDASNDADAAVAGTALVCDNTPTAGADVVLGTADADILCGLGGGDVFRGLAGDDLIFGGPGLDEVSYAGAPGTKVDLRRQGLGLVGAWPRSGAGHGRDSFTGIENARGGSFADLLTGNGVVNRLYGGAGADELTGLKGIDWLYGGTGADVCREAADHQSSC